MKKFLFWMIGALGLITTIAALLVVINLCINCDI